MKIRIPVRLTVSKIESGGFSSERLVHFQGTAGQSLAALVDADSIDSTVSDSIRVSQLEIDEVQGRALVQLPTADGERVWVQKGSLLS